MLALHEGSVTLLASFLGAEPRGGRGPRCYIGLRRSRAQSGGGCRRGRGLWCRGPPFLRQLEGSHQIGLGHRSLPALDVSLAAWLRGSSANFSPRLSALAPA